MITGSKSIYISGRHYIKFVINNDLEDDDIKVYQLEKPTCPVEDGFAGFLKSLVAIHRGMLQLDPKILFSECNEDTFSRLETSFNDLIINQEP